MIHFGTSKRIAERSSPDRRTALICYTFGGLSKNVFTGYVNSFFSLWGLITFITVNDITKFVHFIVFI